MLSCICLRKMPAFAEPFERASHKPTAASSLKKKKWMHAWSRRCARKNASAHFCAWGGRLGRVVVL